MTVLIMDSDETSRRLLRRILEQAGAGNVLEAADGAQGLHLIERHTPDLIILEEALPLICGLECLEVIRASEAHRTTPVIVTTHRNTEPVVRKFIAYGIDDFIVKPLRPRLVIERLGRTLAELRSAAGPALVAPTSNMELGNPVLLIDGSETYRDFFRSEGSHFFQVLTASSGAEGLAMAIDAIPRAVFFGEETGMLDQGRFVAKMRENRELRDILLFKVASPDKLADGVPQHMQGLLSRSFVSDALRFELARLLQPHLMVEALLGPSTTTTVAFMRATEQAVAAYGMLARARPQTRDLDAGDEPLLIAGIELHGASVGLDVVGRTTYTHGRGFAGAVLDRRESLVGEGEVHQMLRRVVEAAAGRLNAAFAERGLTLAQGRCRDRARFKTSDKRLLAVQLTSEQAQLQIEVWLLGASADATLAPPTRASAHGGASRGKVLDQGDLDALACA